MSPGNLIASLKMGQHFNPFPRLDANYSTCQLHQIFSKEVRYSAHRPQMDQEELCVDEEGHMAASFEGILSMVGSDSVPAVTSVIALRVDLHCAITYHHTYRISRHVAIIRS